jgi:hypothetical protein
VKATEETFASCISCGVYTFIQPGTFGHECCLCFTVQQSMPTCYPWRASRQRHAEKECIFGILCKRINDVTPCCCVAPHRASWLQTYTQPWHSWAAVAHGTNLRLIAELVLESLPAWDWRCCLGTPGPGSGRLLWSCNSSALAAGSAMHAPAPLPVMGVQCQAGMSFQELSGP